VTFLSPVFLLGTLLAALPILIHLWHRRRLKKIFFSSLYFLKTSEAQRLGWLRLREILILAARCLFVIFIFLALARPRSENRLFRLGRLASVMLIVDDSYSIAYGDNPGSVKALAGSLISSYSSNSEFCVVRLCDPQPGSWVDQRSALAQIERIEPGYKTGFLADAMSCLPAPGSRYELEYVYIGDGQERNFQGFEKPRTNAANFYWLKVAVGNNLGIARVSLKDPVGLIHKDYIMKVEITNFSHEQWTGKVGLRAADYYHEEPCAIPPRENRTVEFVVPVSHDKGEVRLLQDRLEVDNIYYFAKVLPRERNVLIVNDDRFLRAGLEPGRLSTPFRVTSTAELAQCDLRRFDIIVLNGSKRLTGVDRIRLEDFLARDGTGLFVLLGDQLDDGLRSFLKEWVEISALVRPKGYATIKWFDPRHPIFEIFARDNTLKDIKFYRFWEVSARHGVVARFNNDYPFIIVQDRIVIASTQFRPEDTDLVYKSAFVPLLYRLITSLADRSSSREFLVDDRIPAAKNLVAEDYFSKPGFYALAAETVAVNVDPAEGDLQQLGRSRAEVLGIKTIDSAAGFTGADLSTPLLYLALFMLFFEMLLLLIR
jgi:hypothetical protein